jgi:Na+-transporting methylmalonyl-CoA/oxaloacetate decarboxylase gamma subunit
MLPALLVPAPLARDELSSSRSLLLLQQLLLHCASCGIRATTMAPETPTQQPVAAAAAAEVAAAAAAALAVVVVALQHQHQQQQAEAAHPQGVASP